MTREEAIRKLEDTIEYRDRYCNEHDIERNALTDALDVAIAALMEQEERSSKKISTIEELKSFQGRCVLWNGEICSCKNGYLVTDNGTFSFNWVFSHGEVYSCPMCGRRLEEV